MLGRWLGRSSLFGTWPLASAAFAVDRLIDGVDAEESLISGAFNCVQLPVSVLGGDDNCEA